MKANRRKFLKTAGVMGAGTFLGIARSPAELNATLAADFSRIGFDPALGGSGFFVVLTDLHMAPSFANVQTTEIDQRIIDEINAMDPAPGMIVVSGDLATAATAFTGKSWLSTDEVLVREEFEIGMAQLARFKSTIPIKIIPGNHDTYTYEQDAVLWREYTGSPPYHTMIFNGLKIIFLNSAHSGDINPVQQAWFEQEVQSAGSDEEIYVVMHHPLGSAIGGRGVGVAFKQAFANHIGKIWAAAGHIHRFRFHGFQLNAHATVIQNITTTGNPVVFNDSKNPGYSLVCVSEGRVQQHYHRDVKTSGVVALPNPNRAASYPELPAPLAELAFPLLVCEEGKYDRDAFIKSIVGWDVSGHWWSYVHELELEFDLGNYDYRASQVVFLASYRTSYALITEVSADGGVTWVATSNASDPGTFVYVDIPVSLQGAENLLMRLSTTTPRYSFNFFLAGFALIPDPSLITDLDQWRWEHYGSILNRGAGGLHQKVNGAGMTNLEKFAFNVDPSSDEVWKVDSSRGSYKGFPGFELSPEGFFIYEFVRRKDGGNIGITYHFLQDSGSNSWIEVPHEDYSVTDLGGQWELVSLVANLSDPGVSQTKLYRVSISMDPL